MVVLLKLFTSSHTQQIITYCKSQVESQSQSLATFGFILLTFAFIFFGGFAEGVHIFPYRTEKLIRLLLFLGSQN